MFDPNQMMGGGGPPMGPSGPPAPAPSGGAGSVTSPPSGDHTDNIRHAIELLDQYMTEENDDEDLALVSKIQADLQKLLANNQKLTDTAVGAGPGAKFLRKQNGGGGSQGGGY